MLLGVEEMIVITTFYKQNYFLSEKTLEDFLGFELWHNMIGPPKNGHNMINIATKVKHVVPWG